MARELSAAARAERIHELDTLQQENAQMAEQIQAFATERDSLEFLLSELPVDSPEMTGLVLKRLKFKKDLALTSLRDELKDLMETVASSREDIQLLAHLQEGLEQENTKFRSDIAALEEERAALLQQRETLEGSLPGKDRPLTMSELRTRVAAIEADCELRLRDMEREAVQARHEIEVNIERLQQECDRGQEAVEALSATVREYGASLDESKLGARRTMAAFRAAEQARIEDLAARLRMVQKAEG